MEKKVTIREIESPNLVIEMDGDRYELLCEFQAKDGIFQDVYLKAGGTDVVVEIGKDRAVVGLFSVENNKVKQLFDYIEAGLRRQDGFVCYSSDIENYLEQAREVGGKYPFILNGMRPRNFMFAFVRDSAPLDEATARLVEEHMVESEHVRDALDFETDEDMFIEEPDEEFMRLPKVSQAGLLPEGWRWVDYPDLSGYLEAPDGKQWFQYDVHHEAYVEFKRDDDSRWSSYPGLFEDFKHNAERAIQVHVLENDGSLKDMGDMKFYVIEDKRNNFSIEYFEEIGTALERFQEAKVDAKKFPALGVRIGDGSLDLLHGVNGDAVLVPDYRHTDNFSEPMKAAEGEIQEAVRWLIEEKWAVTYEYQNDILPGWLQGDVTVLVPVTLGDEPKNSYCNGKVLKTELQSGIDAIDSLYIEMHGWVGYSELLKHTQEYAPEGFIKVPQMNVVYVQEKNVVGIDGRMDVAPSDFKAMVNDINKPYTLTVYDGTKYTGEFRGKHDFIVASYDDVASAVKGWYELQEKRQVPALVQNRETREVLFNGYDENNMRMSFEEAAKKFGFDGEGLDERLLDAVERAGKTESKDNERDLEI